MRPLLSLCMMVKDEAKSLKAVLEAARPHVDCYTIIDTGSTDGTQDIVREVMQGIKGRLLEKKWHGYAGTRNLVLGYDAERSVTTVFQLMLSGDEYLHDGEGLRKYLSPHRDTNIDCHFIQVALESGLVWQPRILRTGSKWRYDDFDLGIHEVPVHPDANAPKRASTGGQVKHVVTDPIARMDNIWEKHIPMLREALERNPENVRALEYLIQSLESFLPYPEEGETPEERKKYVRDIGALYVRRFAMPFLADEQRRHFMASFIDTMRLDEDVPREKLMQMAATLCSEDPDRPEPFFLRAQIAAKDPLSLTSDVYNLARQAAEVAERVRKQGGLTNATPYNMAIEWQSHRLAAIAAANLAKKYPENLPLARDHVAAGLAVGGPWMAFKGLVEGAEPTAPPTESEAS